MDLKRLSQKDRKTQAGQFLAAALVLILPNLLFVVLAHFMSVQRPWINVDYALILLLSLWLPRTVLALVLVLLLAVDFLALAAQIFPVISWVDKLYLLSFVGLAPVTYQVGVVALSIILVALIVWIYRMVKRSSPLASLLIANMVIIPYALMASGSESLHGGNYREGRSALLDSQIAYQHQRWVDYSGRFSGAFADLEYGAVEALTGPLFASDAIEEDRLLLIVSESWGEPTSSVQEVLLAPVLERSDQLSDLSWGAMNFDGVTVQGEIRELCNARLTGVRVSGVKDSLAGCLPQTYHAHGHHTVAMHGAVGTMYERRDWYPYLNFSETIFFESRSWPRRCYSFPGACDIDMTDEVLRVMGEHKQVFFYWLTLNSHHSYDPRDIDRKRFSCADFSIDENTQSCRNLHLHAQFFDALADLIDDPVMRGVRVMVVGDHDPVIVNREEKELYFNPGRVAWLDFRVKGNE